MISTLAGNFRYKRMWPLVFCRMKSWKVHFLTWCLPSPSIFLLFYVIFSFCSPTVLRKFSAFSCHISLINSLLYFQLMLLFLFLNSLYLILTTLQQDIPWLTLIVRLSCPAYLTHTHTHTCFCNSQIQRTKNTQNL